MWWPAVCISCAKAGGDKPQGERKRGNRSVRDASKYCTKNSVIARKRDVHGSYVGLGGGLWDWCTLFLVVWHSRTPRRQFREGNGEGGVHCRAIYACGLAGIPAQSRVPADAPRNKRFHLDHVSLHRVAACPCRPFRQTGSTAAFAPGDVSSDVERTSWVPCLPSPTCSTRMLLSTGRAETVLSPPDLESKARSKRSRSKQTRALYCGVTIPFRTKPRNERSCAGVPTHEKLGT